MGKGHRLFQPRLRPNQGQGYSSSLGSHRCPDPPEGPGVQAFIYQCEDRWTGVTLFVFTLFEDGW